MGEKSFSISGKGLKFDNATQVQSIINDLAMLEDLEEVTLSGNSFGIEATEAVATVLSTKKSLQICNFGDIFTGRLRSEIPKSLDAFARVLKDKPIKVLDLSDNAFGPDGLRPIVPLVSSLTSLQVLKLNNTGLGPQGGILLAQALNGLHESCKEQGVESSLRVLVCGRSRLENGSMDALSSALKLHIHLSELILPQDGIRPEGIVKLMDGLSACCKLEVLDLQDNTFTESASLVFASTLSSWPLLKKLNIGDCMLTAKGSRKIFEHLAVLSKLEVLNLQYNEIDDKSVLYLATILKEFKALKSLELNGNCFSEDGVGADSVRSALDEMGKGDEKVLGKLSDMEEDDSDQDIEDDADELADELAEM